MLYSSARTAGIKESRDQCCSDMGLDNSSSLGLIKKIHQIIMILQAALSHTQGCKGDREEERDAVRLVKKGLVLNLDVGKRNSSTISDNTALKNLPQISQSIVHCGS